MAQPSLLSPQMSIFLEPAEYFTALLIRFINTCSSRSAFPDTNILSWTCRCKLNPPYICRQSSIQELIRLERLNVSVVNFNLPAAILLTSKRLLIRCCNLLMDSLAFTTYWLAGPDNVFCRPIN